MPQLLVLGEYEPENRTGPSIWLRCVVDRVLELPGLASRHHTRGLPTRRESADTRLGGSLSEQPEAAGGASVPGYVLDAEERPGLDGGGVHGLQRWRPWSGRGSRYDNSAVHAGCSVLNSPPHRSACWKAGASKQTISMHFSPMIRSGTCSSGSASPNRCWRAGRPGDGAPLHRVANPTSDSTRTRMARCLPRNDSVGVKDRGGRCGADSSSPRRCTPACRSFCARRCRTICSSSRLLPGLRTTKRVKRSCDEPSRPWKGKTPSAARTKIRHQARESPRPEARMGVGESRPGPPRARPPAPGRSRGANVEGAWWSLPGRDVRTVRSRSLENRCRSALPASPK